MPMPCCALDRSWSIAATSSSTVSSTRPSSGDGPEDVDVQVAVADVAVGDDARPSGSSPGHRRARSASTNSARRARGSVTSSLWGGTPVPATATEWPSRSAHRRLAAGGVLRHHGVLDAIQPGHRLRQGILLGLGAGGLDQQVGAVLRRAAAAAGPGARRRAASHSVNISSAASTRRERASSSPAAATAAGIPPQPQQCRRPPPTAGPAAAGGGGRTPSAASLSPADR